MKLPCYELEAEKSLMVFGFVSEGPKGKIPKLVKFSETNFAGFYNLAFGDKDPITGNIDDTVISNNADSEKVLASVVAPVYIFTEQHPGSWIYATNSTKARTRLYQMGISRYYNEIKTIMIFMACATKSGEIFKRKLTMMHFLSREKRSKFVMNIKVFNKKKVRVVVRIDSSLEKYKKLPSFQDKVDEANKMLKNAGLPKPKK